MTFSPCRSSRAAFIVLAMFVVLCLGCSGTGPGLSTAPPEATPTSSLLVTGRAISPAGITSDAVGGMPLNVVVSPDGKYAVTTSSSLDERLCVLRISDGAIVSSVGYPTMGPTVTPLNNGLFYGLVFGPGNTLYAAQGTCGQVAVLGLSADGILTPVRTIVCATQPVPANGGSSPAGLALDAGGHLYITNHLPTDIVDPHPPQSTMSIYDAASGGYLGQYVFPGTTPCYPLTVTVKSDGSRAYVTSQRDDCVYVLNTSVPSNPTLVTTISSGSHPNALVMNRAETRLYVANAQSDTVSVVDTGTNQVLSTVLLRPANVWNLPGISPTGLALSPDEATLYASLGDFNAVAVIHAGKMQLRGYIPVGWYPTAVAASPDDTCLLVTNGWGTTAMNPNPQFNYLDPSFLSVTNTYPPGWAASPAPGYVLNSIPGNVSRIDLSQALPDLDESTVRVVQNAQNTPAAGTADGSALARLGVDSGKIKHVIYVVRENRSYDEVLGDLPYGNGAPALATFGAAVTPNAHALAQRFVLLDNFYNNAPVSGEGWTWCTQGQANEFAHRTMAYLYRLAPATYSINYAFEGQNTNYITGGYPATDPDGKPLSVAYPNGQPAIPNIAEGLGGYIWDAVKAAGRSYRNYGFFLSTGVASPPANPANPQGARYIIPDNYPTVANLQPPGHDLEGLSDYDFRHFDFNYSDSDAWVRHELPGPALKAYGKHGAKSRFAEWNHEFQAMLKKDPTGGAVPNFMTVRFMRDHTMGTSPGFESPSSMIADNDFAVGQLVDAVSHSPIWSSTVIFVIEDDAQFGPDHVDAHRSPCFVISPWIKKGSLDSHFYDTNSVLKSMELILGLAPMNQYDAYANPIGGWDSAPNNAQPYEAILPARSIIGGVNPPLSSYGPRDPRRRMAVLSSQMNFRVADAAPNRLLNEIVWKSVRGPRSTMPEPRINKMPCLDRLNPRGSEDEDDD